MKKVLMALVVSGLSLARPLPLGNVRLEVQTNPLGPKPAKVSRLLQVKNNGSVSLRTCNTAIPPRPGFKACTTKEIARLTAYEIDRIDREIDLARRGKIKKWSGPICKALPTETRKYSADNGRVFLKQGPVPCGAPTYNDSAAATSLVGRLNTLLAKAHVFND